MLAVSTTYHRWVHTIRARAAWRRADHAAIFAAIAGTFTALALTSLDTGPAIAVPLPSRRFGVAPPEALTEPPLARLTEADDNAPTTREVAWKRS